MPGPFEATGAVKQPTSYGALGMGSRQMTGMWTQRSPYRDAAVSYLIGKFYGGSRFDSILDGVNREISMRLTDVRRPGSVVYNSGSFPPANSFYSFSCIQNLARTIRVILDGTDGNIYDATHGGKTTLFSRSSDTVKTRFLGVANELFFTDGSTLEAWLTPSAIWQASTNITPGTLINSGASPYSLQMALGGITLDIVASSSDGTNITVYIDPENIPDQFPNLYGVNVKFTGATVATSLNGNTYAVRVICSTLGILEVTQAQSAYVQTTDTGTGTTGTGTTGATLPAFSATKFTVTADGGQQWKCYYTAMMAWGLPGPTKAPIITPQNGTRFWQAMTAITQWYALLDPNGNIEVYEGTGATTGRAYPNFAGASTITVPSTVDGGVTWFNVGQAGSWAGLTAFGNPGQVQVIIDTNGNLQLVTNGNGANSGATVPTWATSIGTTTSDGGLTWTCLGPGVTLTTDTIQYSFSTHSVDGSVSTASPVATIQGPILGPPDAAADAPLQYLSLVCKLNLSLGIPNQDPTDQIWIWRTPQGQQGTLILEDQVPIDTFQTHSGTNPYLFVTYDELGIPDTSTNGNGALDALIAAPVASANNPPPNMISGANSGGATAPAYHMNRIWMIQGNSVIYSGGPDTIVGNGNTAFPPLNAFGFQGVPLRLVPVTVQNGGLLVYTTAGIMIILGTGTAANPFYSTSYFDKVNLGGYDALDTLGPAHFLMEANGKVSSIAVEYPFNPQGGYTEIGFPIGDQFLNTTTGGSVPGGVFEPSGTFVSWNIANTTDTGMYVADGRVGWFRMSNAAQPESGIIWSPRASIVGGTSAVQSIETAPGIFTLLIGPTVLSSTGPVLARDQSGSVFADNGTAYPAWDVKGVTLLCSTGEVSELAAIAAKSTAVGSRPKIGLLMNEIQPTTTNPFIFLEPVYQDPANLPPSKTVFSDSYNCLQNGAIPKGDAVSLRFDYGSQAFGDELLDFQIWGRKDEFRLSATAG